MSASPWSEAVIGRELFHNFFKRQHLMVVNNCGWTGSECDLLVVTKKLHIIDVEIKISRSDFKADRLKDKWRFSDGGVPRRVWKHYYVMPADIWTPDLLPHAGSPKSGVLLLSRDKWDRLQITSVRKAEANKAPYKLTPEQVLDLARLTSLRLWDAYQKLHRRSS